MPEPVIRTNYKCIYCERIYEKQSEAIDCEEHHKKIQKNIKKLSVFPDRHKKDVHGIKHCVKCGDVIFESEKIFDGYDGHKNEYKIVHHKAREYRFLFDGYWCISCEDKLEEKIIELLIKDKDNEIQKYPEADARSDY